MNIEIIKDERLSSSGSDFYFVKVNGKTVFECLNKVELEELTIWDILKFYSEEID